jgi:hypothetical protein
MSRAGIFGWSYPPGCSGPPDDGPEPPCQMCGEYEDKCPCPECPVEVTLENGFKTECGTVGCLKHMPIADLLASEQKFYSLHQRREEELKRRSIAEAVMCEKCGGKVPKDFLDGMEFCDKCKKLVGRDDEGEE